MRSRPFGLAASGPWKSVASPGRTCLTQEGSISMTAISRQAEPLLAGDFPAYDEQSWRELVGKVLKGGDFDKRLVRTTADGIAIRPLYAPGDDSPWIGTPGEAPFVRGASAAGSALGGWDIRGHHVVGDPAATNRAILEDLEGGATSVHLRFDRAPPSGFLQPLLENVLLDVAPVALEAGAHVAEVAAQLLQSASAQGVDPASIHAQLNADPLGTAVRGGTGDLAGALRDAMALAGTVAATWPNATALLADGRAYHGGGASEAQELAFAVATGLDYLRHLCAADLPAEAAAGQVAFALAADGDFFLTVVKLRVLRRLWSRVLAVAGAEPAMPRLRLHAETASRMLTRLDPHVNILRGTVAAFAAAAGGASSVTVLPFDHADGSPSPLARRIARNTQLVLLEESNLGRVIDPAGGSWLVERLSEELAAKAWTLLQEVERRGGMAAALEDGWPQELVARSRERLEQAVATRRAGITGVSEFSDPAEGVPDQKETAADHDAGPVRVIPPYRLAESFEQVRARGDRLRAATGRRPVMFLATLGTPAQFAPRQDFARNLFEAGGFEVSAGEASAFAASGARQAAICSSDVVYGERAEAATRALRQAGASGIYLMGRPVDATLQATWSAAGVDEFVFAGCDVLSVLDRAHDRETGGRA